MVVGRVRRTGWHRVGFGLYRRETDLAAPWCDLVAWSQVLPSSGVLTHLTAAALHDLWLPPLPDGLPVIVSMAKAQTRPKRPEVTVIRHTRPVARTTRRGLPVATVEETLLACARDLALLDLVVLGDSALQAGRTTREALLASASRRRWGAPALTRAVGWMDGRSESPWESLLRVLHRMCAVPVEPQHEVRDAAGRFVARGDLWLVGSRMLHEYDGEGTATGPPTSPTSTGTGDCSRPAGTVAATPPWTCCTGPRRSCVRPTRRWAAGTGWTVSTRGGSRWRSRCSTRRDGSGSPYAWAGPQVAGPDSAKRAEPVGIGHSRAAGHASRLRGVARCA